MLTACFEESDGDDDILVLNSRLIDDRGYRDTRVTKRYSQLQAGVSRVSGALLFIFLDRARSTTVRSTRICVLPRNLLN